MEKRSILIRTFSLLGWLIVFYIVTNILIGAIVGGIAGASETSYEAGAIAGEAASKEFFRRYALIILGAQIFCFSVLAYLSIFPGTSKYKNVKNT